MTEISWRESYLAKHFVSKLILWIRLIRLRLSNVDLLSAPSIIHVVDGAQVLSNDGSIPFDADERIGVLVHGAGQSAGLYFVLDKHPFGCSSTR